MLSQFTEDKELDQDQIGPKHVRPKKLSATMGLVFVLLTLLSPVRSRMPGIIQKGSRTNPCERWSPFRPKRKFSLPSRPYSVPHEGFSKQICQVLKGSHDLYISLVSLEVPPM